MSASSTIAFHTLGCKLNFAETSTIGRQFDEAGYERRGFQEEADVYVINTCSVTENADKECQQLIRRVKRQNPEAQVVITGCYAQLKPDIIAALEGVDLVVGTQEKFNMVEHLQSYTRNGRAKIHSCDIDEVTNYHASYSQKRSNPDVFESTRWL
jgi:threonylcarbamoyladenosine tRNA methylthiotransferase MtaB